MWEGMDLSEQKRKIQVQIIFDDGARTALTTLLIWEGSSQVIFIRLWEQLKHLMVTQHLGLAEAYQLIDRKEI